MEIKRLLTPKQVMELDGIGQTAFYKRCAAGEYVCVKDGQRTKVTEESVLRRREGLPKAEYNVRTGVRGVQHFKRATQAVTA
jgi:hypothetical protein